MPSNDIFSTYPAAKQAEIVVKLMELFKGNERFHGAADVKGSKRDEEKNKWRPGNPRFVHKTLTEADWRAHLIGERFIGTSPLLDDGTVWFTCMDVDKIGNDINYEIDYAQEMWKIKASKFPLIVYRTKSGGLRITIFFSEPVEADLAIKRMKQMAAQLGYAGCEIFPKQAKIDAEHGDCSNWIFLPYGPHSDDMFPEQCCMNESGNAMELYESVIYAIRRRITKQQFFDLFVEEFKAKANGKANGKNHPKGKWIDPNGSEAYDLTVKTMFWDGPICLFYIALEKCRDNQHYFLFNCGIFFRRKYSENWDQALTWVNFNVLTPVGDREKLDAMIKDFKNKGDRPYEYTCKNEPICSRCHSYACKTRPYGVGRGNGTDYSEMAITIYNSKPQIFFVSMGDERVLCTPDDLLTLRLYKKKCLEYTSSFPDNISQKEWERIVKSALENAAIVDPPEVLKTNAKELMIMEEWLSIYITSGIRRNYGEFMQGKWGDYVRIREDEKRIYFKAKRLFHAVRMRRGPKEEQELTAFVGNKCMEHRQGPGAREWFRYTYSIGFDQFDEEVRQKWFDPDREQRDE